jgi:hypothetical protein
MKYCYSMKKINESAPAIIVIQTEQCPVIIFLLLRLVAYNNIVGH